MLICFWIFASYRLEGFEIVTYFIDVIDTIDVIRVVIDVIDTIDVIRVIDAIDVIRVYLYWCSFWLFRLE